MGTHSGGNPGDVRKSALWGSGNRGGEHRSNALWGKGGRGFVTTALVVALAVPLAAGAGGGSRAPVSAGGYVSEQLKDKAKQHPNELVSVIIQADAGIDAASKAAKELAKLDRKLELIGAVVAELPARDVEKLERVPGLTVTWDAPVQKSGSGLLSGATAALSAPAAPTSSQLWTHETGVNKLWGGPQAPAIAIVDSGIDKAHPSFGDGSRVVYRKVFGSQAVTSLDGRGHGTFVASIAAGNAAGYAGSAPNAKLIDLDVMDDNGAGRTSDVIAAAQWINDNRVQYGIKVANFSLHSQAVNHFWLDPLNVAVEKLWFNGVVVVAAAGNYGKADGPSGVMYAPGSDPFVITVGSIDIGGTARIGDDARAPFSAYGRTPDGFWKPEICAPGRYMVGAIPMGSTIAAQKADKIRATGYIELSGTSFAAPVISGLAAQILARSPGLTPDQVKGNVMRRSRAVPQAAPMSCGVGQLNGTRSALFDGAANPNKALSAFVKTGPDGNSVFDAVSWTDVSWTDVSWDAVSWTDVSWTDVSWDAVSWTDVSWTDVSWTDVSWTDVSWEDAADGETLDGDGYELTPEEATAAESDPDL
ncbi:MAG TPA: S8 family serine peptidase, partial [Gaiellaceae bacterium]|nr:S8 family serine peptidase [Gaiellaceae bacterium]